MEQGMETLQQACAGEAPAASLEPRIRGALTLVQIRARRTILLVSIFSCLLSAGVTVWVAERLIAASARTGFPSFALLAVSDSSLVASHLSTYLLSLLESLPALESISLLAVLAIFLVSLRGIFGTIRRPSSFVPRFAS